MAAHPFRSHFSAIGVGFGLAALIGGAAFIAVAISGDEDAFAAGAKPPDDGGAVIQITSDEAGGAGEFKRRKNGQEIKATWEGDFEIAGDGRRFQRLDGQISIKVKEQGSTRSVSFKGVDGQPVIITARDGDDVIEAAAQRDALAGDLVLRLARSSALSAKSRVASLLDDGGVPSVLAEIDRLDGDYATRRYIKALLHQATLTASEIESIAERVLTLKGDYDQRTAIVDLFKMAAVSPESAAALLGAAQRMESDYEKRQVIIALAQNAGVSPWPAMTSDKVLDLLGSLKSDYEARLAAEALIASSAFADDDIGRLIGVAADRIESDYEIRLLMEAAAPRAEEPSVAIAMIAALRGVNSDYEQRLSVAHLADALPATSDQWTPFIVTLARIDGDRDRRLALESVAERMPREPGNIAAYREIANSLDNARDRSQALARIEE